MKTVSVIGEGAWGTAVATLLAHNGYTVKLWCQDPKVADQIVRTRVNEKYLSGITLDEKIKPTTDLRMAMCDTELIFEAIPVKYLRSVISQARVCVSPDQTWVVLSKGIEQNTLLLPTQIIDDVLGHSPNKIVMVGPSFALDLAQKQITAVVIAAQDCERGAELQRMLANNYFRPYISTDLMGAQAGAALKNVITLAIGMLDGAGYRDNAKAFLLTRGLHEMTELVVALGGKIETIYGLAGAGDLVLTATGTLSRNLNVGRILGQGKKLADIERAMGGTPEGINTVQAVHQMQRQKKLNLPICREIYEVIFSGKSVQAMLSDLMSQPLTQECET